MKTMELNNIVWRGDKHFVAQCLNVDVSSFGDSKEEALDNLREAHELYFEDDDIETEQSSQRTTNKSSFNPSSGFNPKADFK
jgi:predicted RNase H-like HicB family nuclease